jgi:hypothetical protein
VDELSIGELRVERLVISERIDGTPDGQAPPVPGF